MWEICCPVCFIDCIFHERNYVVTPVGLEPTRLATSDPKSELATNYNRGPLYFGQDRTRFAYRDLVVGFLQSVPRHYFVGPEGTEPPCNQLRFQRIMSARRYEPFLISSMSFFLSTIKFSTDFHFCKSLSLSYPLISTYKL